MVQNYSEHRAAATTKHRLPPFVALNYKSLCVYQLMHHLGSNTFVLLSIWRTFAGASDLWLGQDCLFKSNSEEILLITPCCPCEKLVLPEFRQLSWWKRIPQDLEHGKTVSSNSNRGETIAIEFRKLSFVLVT